MTDHPTDHEALLSLREQGFSYPEIGAQLGISQDAARGRYRRAVGRRLAGIGRLRPDAVDHAAGLDAGLPAEGSDRPGRPQGLVQLRHYPVGNALPNFDTLYQRRSLADDKRVVERVLTDLENRPVVRLAIISDTHGKNVDAAAFDWALRTIAEEGAHAGIHGGDTFDFNNQSDAHAPTEYASWESELDEGARTLRALEDTGIPWLTVEANHDLRPNKQFANRLPPHYLPWVASPLRTLVDRTPNIWLPNKPAFQAWWIALGDIIVGHVELAAGVESVARKAHNAFTLRGHDYGLPESPIRGVFAGHPHKFRQQYLGRRAVVVDLDCLQTTPGYALTGPGVKYKESATQGIVFVTLNYGRLDLDSVTHRVFVP